ncbi:MAG: hypothetical protein R3F59_05890 [Myxococcota bacterium]
MWMLLALTTGADARPGLDELRVDAPAGICPGEVVRLEITGIDDRGRERKIRATPRADLAYDWSLGEVSDRGELTGPTDPRAAWGDAGELTVTAEGVSATVAVPLRFDCTITLDATGREGYPGEQGPEGGGSSTKGNRGQPGHPGDPGHDAPEVHLRTFLTADPRTGEPVLQIEAQRLGDDALQYFAIHPASGELVVHAVGGRGGMGGRGGDGGDADEKIGIGGDGAEGGRGGKGGAGGLVRVFADPTSEGQLANIIVENWGGEGGPGGQPGNAGSGKAENTARPGRPGVPGRRARRGRIRRSCGRRWACCGAPSSRQPCGAAESSARRRRRTRSIASASPTSAYWWAASS